MLGILEAVLGATGGGTFAYCSSLHRETLNMRKFVRLDKKKGIRE